MYRKIAYKILKEEYSNIFEGLDWIPTQHVYIKKYGQPPVEKMY